MTDTEYQLISTLMKLRTAEEMIRGCFPLDQPHKARMQSCLGDIGILITDLEGQVAECITGE